MQTKITRHNLRDFLGTPLKIQSVKIGSIDGRDQVVLYVEDETTGATILVPLSREDARELTRAWGPHPLVEKFFREGKGLQ
jgi:hypothetical protein